MKARLQMLQEAQQTYLQSSMEEAKSMEETLGEASSPGHPAVLGRIFARQ